MSFEPNVTDKYFTNNQNTAACIQTLYTIYTLIYLGTNETPAGPKPPISGPIHKKAATKN